MSENKIVLSSSSFRVLSVEDTIKLYTSNLTDNDIKAFVWYNRTLGIPMTGYEKWFIFSEKKVITAKEDIECLNQQYENIGKIQSGDEVGKITRFENEYKGVTYVAIRRFDNSLCLVDKSKIDLDASKHEAPKQELDELVKSFSLMYIDGMYLPLHVYTNTDYDILKVNLERDKGLILEKYGEAVYEYHKNIISGFTTMQVNHPIKANRFKLNPFGEIAREVKVVNEDGRESNITESFLEWTRSLKASDYELVTREVFRERIVWNGTSRGKFSNLDKDEREEANKREKADAELECERLFSEYLTNIIDSDTQKVINKRVNETYNQSIKINTSKVPVGFVCSNKFKQGSFVLRDVQIEAFKFAVSRNNFCLALTVGFGKGNLLTSNIITPKGLVKMGDIVIGDDVIGKNGLPTKVVGVFPLGKVQCYRVKFSDGTYADVSDEHLWAVQSFNEREKRSKKYGEWQVLETKAIKDNLINKRGDFRYSIPMTDTVEFESKDVKLDPYILGLLIGDGYLSKDKIMFSNTEADIVEKFTNYLKDNKCDYSIYKNKDYSVKSDNKTKSNIRIWLEDLGLIGKLSNEKFIPNIYKFNSPKVRLKLLQGLLDTDGFISKNKSLIYTTVSKKLCYDVVFLVQSFGGTCSVNEKIPKYTYKGEKKLGQKAYNITINLPENITPISSEKQLRKYVANTKYKPIRFITEIEDIGKQDAQCIKVDAEDELYLCDSFIVTHNTSVAISILSYLIGTGTIKKPLVVVPKPVLKNWQKEMFGYYTNGKTFSFSQVEGWTFEYGILTNCDIDFSIINNLSKKYRADALKLQFKQKCVALASYEALEKMYIGDEDVRLFVIDVWKGLLEQSFAKDETEKESAKKISTLISRLNKVDKDAEVDIMKLGFDSIYFDEAHRLKNLFSGVSADKTNRISSGFKGNPSNRSLRAFYLTQYLQKIKGRIGFLTATPFSNSPLEVYTMLVFLNFSELVKNNVFKIKNFVEIFFNETLEYKVNQSNKIVSESVMKNYKNKPILYKILSNTFIYKDDPKSAGIKRPCLITYPNKNIPLMLSQSPLQELQRDALTGKLQDTEYYINKYPEVEPYVDDFLSQFSSMSSTTSRLGMKGKILMSSKSSALSPFAQSPLMLPFQTNENWREVYEFSPKIKFCVDAIKYMVDFHKSRNEKVSSFLIYMEFGVNILPQVKESLEKICGFGKGQSFSLSNEEDDDDDDLRGGKIFYDEVEIIDGSADSEKEANRRERIAQLFNKGLVKVIIGTSTIKEGINLQENSATEFILTPSWNSTDINQVIGRIHRQGNRFPLVRVIMPVVARTLDSFIFQKYEEKKSRLNDVWQDNEVSTTESDDVNISADKQKELILNDADEIASIRVDMLKKKEINEYNKIKDEFDALEKAISKSDMYKYYTNYFGGKLSEMLSLAESNKLNLKILLDYIDKGNSEPLINRKKDRIALLFDYYIDLIESIKKAIETRNSTDIINIFKGNFKRRDYHLSFEFYDEDNFKKLANTLRLQNIEWLLDEDIFKVIGISKRTKYYNESFESINDFIQINADCLNSEKFILNPEGVSLSSPNEDLQRILQKYQERISSKIAAIEKNFEIENNYRGFDLLPKDTLKEQLKTQAKIELDGENKLALLGDKLASYFAQKTNKQLTYTYNNIDINQCDIPFEEMDVESMKLESINVDEIPRDYANYKKLYEKLNKVVLDLDEIKIGYTQKVGKKGDAFMPLSIEMQELYDEQNVLGKYGTRLIMEQNYVQNGDLMTDPRIDFAIYKEDKIAIPINYENNGMGIYTEYVKDGKVVDLKNLNGTIKFCIDIWFKNLIEQDRVIGTKKVVELIKDESGQVKAKRQRLDINTIGDKFFKENPTHILGEMSISDFRGQIIVKGTKQDVVDYFDKELSNIEMPNIENTAPITETKNENIPQKVIDGFSDVSKEENFSFINIDKNLWRRNNKTGEIVSQGAAPELTLPNESANKTEYYKLTLDLQQPDTFELTNFKRPIGIKEIKEAGFIFKYRLDIPNENSSRMMDVYSKNGQIGEFVFNGDNVYKLVPFKEVENEKQTNEKLSKYGEPVELNIEDSDKDPTPLKDEYNEMTKNIDKTKRYTNLSDLKIGDYVGVNDNYGNIYEGVLTSIGSKNIKIKTPYGRSGNDYISIQELQFDKSKIIGFYKNNPNKKNESKETKKPVIQSNEGSNGSNESKPTKVESITNAKVDKVERTTEEREITTEEIANRLKKSGNEYFYIECQNFDEYQIWYGSNVFSLYSKKKNEKKFHKESLSSGGVFALVEYIESKQKQIFKNNILRNGVNVCGFRKSSNDQWSNDYLSIKKIEVDFPDDEIEDEYTISQKLIVHETKKDSKSEIEEAIEALEILAEMGNKEAEEAIDALKILLD